MDETKFAGPAPIIRAAIASLTDLLPAHIAAFNAEPANQVELVFPVAIAFGAEAEMVAYPVVEVSILRGALGPFSVGQAGTGDADHDPDLQVIVWLMGDTGEVPRLYEQAIGYARCVIEALTQRGALGETAEVAGDRPDAIRYIVAGPIPLDPANVDRELRRWKVPTIVEFTIAAVETFVPL